MDNQTPPQSPAVSEGLIAFVRTQFQNGLQPNEITAQLKTAGWGDEAIRQAFTQVQAQMTPNLGVPPPPQTTPPAQLGTNPTVTTQPGPIQVSAAPKRGRLKTGWLLFKETWKLLRSDKMLMRYVLMSGVASVVLVAIYAIILVVGHHALITTSNAVDSDGTKSVEIALTPAGVLLTFVYYVLAYFVVNLYAAGLAANVLDLFHGNKQSYAAYMKKARSRAVPLFFFSLIEATVGLILRIIEDRVALLGRIIVWIIGAAWSLARLFVVPIIVSTDEGAVSAIKSSTKLLVSTWGENLAGRVSMGGLLVLVYIFVAIPIYFVLFLVFVGLFGIIGMIISLALSLLTLIAFIIISTTASSILNTALYYYARNRQIPAIFDSVLLNQAFVSRKPGRFFGSKKSAQPPLSQ